MRILMTGATGCVGRYMVAEFLANTDHDLVLIVRDPSRIAVAPEHRHRITTAAGDLRDLASFEPVLAGVDAALLIATAWGGADVEDITVGANVALADRLIETGCQHIVYFASASVLGRDAALLPEALEHGTGYIRAKHRLVSTMEERAGRARITGLFPTLVFGGDIATQMPLSHLARLLVQVRKHLWLIRRISAEGRFHVIHAADIARVTRALVEGAGAEGTGIEGAGTPERFVLGNPARMVSEMIGELVTTAGRRYRPLIRLTSRNVDFFIRLFRMEVTPWDRYCMANPDQSYDMAVNPAAFGAPVAMPDLATGLRAVGLGPTAR